MRTLSLFLLCCVLGLTYCGYKVNNKLHYVYQCDPTLSVLWEADYPMNCSKPIPVAGSNKFRCADPGCEGGSWQSAGESALYSGKSLICCKPLCDTFDCNGALRWNYGKVDPKPITMDYGKTWMTSYEATPTCAGNETKYCFDGTLAPCPTDVDIELFYQQKIYCISNTCTGKMVLNRTQNAWICQDPSCQGNGKQMVYSQEWKRWVCKSPLCKLEDMVYSPAKGKWMCNSNSDYCQQAQQECAWDQVQARKFRF